MPKTFIVIRTQFTAFHKWLAAPDIVAFLRYPHRHVFHVEIKYLVGHDDRDREFFIEKERLENYIGVRYHQHIYNKEEVPELSCEMIAKDIATKFEADYVSVFEDNENGAEYYRTFEPR